MKVVHNDHRLEAKWQTHCRCGASLAFACQDVLTGRPSEDTDFWCSDGDPLTGPHDWGVVIYEYSRIRMYSGIRA
jgi:hypothetical protein